jgi:hypothetical protein
VITHDRAGEGVIEVLGHRIRLSHLPAVLSCRTWSMAVVITLAGLVRAVCGGGGRRR